MDVFRDGRLALRLLLRSPRYAAAVILVLAVAIGANTAIFSAVHGILLRPLPIQAPHDLIVVWDSDSRRSLPVVELSYRTFAQWAEDSRSFSALAAMGSSAWPAILQDRGAPVRLSTAGVSASFFDTLGAHPLIGRTLRREDDRPNAPAVAVLSHASWVKYFGSDSHVLGSIVHVDRARTIVGIMPPEFDFPRGTNLWFPVVPILAANSRPDFDALSSVGVLFAIGRLKPGVTPAAAAVELDGLAQTAHTTSGAGRFGSTLVVTPFLEYVLGPVRQGLWVLSLAGALLLLVACANASGLTLTRALARSREDAVRLAIGASSLDVARPWLAEAALLARRHHLVCGPRTHRLRDRCRRLPRGTARGRRRSATARQKVVSGHCGTEARRD
jgi:putative ABC transport system permease protein